MNQAISHLHPKIQDLIDKLGIQMFTEADFKIMTDYTMPKTAKGMYEHKYDAMVLKKPSINDYFVSIPIERFNHFALHEMSHWTGHYSRLNRISLEQLRQGSPTEEELHTEEATAEMSCVMLAQWLDIDVDLAKRSAENYIKQYSKANLQKATHDAYAAFNFIRNAYETECKAAA